MTSLRDFGLSTLLIGAFNYVGKQLLVARAGLVKN